MKLEDLYLVSIPFKRESGSKVWDPHESGERLLSFNSLQTGKRIQSILSQWVINELSVSIPFKRESGSKETPF